MVKGSLGEVLDALEEDSDFLLEGGVFTPDLLETYIEYDLSGWKRWMLYACARIRMNL